MDRSSPEGSSPLESGGPFFSLLRASRLLGASGDRGMARVALAAVALAWLPLLLLAPLSRGGGQLLTDFAVHARLLLSIPIFLIAENLLTGLCNGVIEPLRARAGIEQEHLESVLRAGARRWNSAAAELTCLAAAVLLGQANLWMVPIGPLQFRLAARPVSAALLWYGLISLPLFYFLLLRSFWRWAVWVQILWRSSRLPMRLLATHPDRCCGLGILAIPSDCFALVFLAFSINVSGTWATQIIHHGVPFTSFATALAALGVVALAIGLGPLLAFSDRILRAKLQARAQYGLLARDYMEQFHQRWVVEARREDLLGTGDIQSLADIGNAFEVIGQVRLMPFDRRSAAIAAGAVLLPMIPLLLTEVPLREIASKLVATIL